MSVKNSEQPNIYQLLIEPYGISIPFPLGKELEIEFIDLNEEDEIQTYIEAEFFVIVPTGSTFRVWDNGQVVYEGGIRG